MLYRPASIRHSAFQVPHLILMLFAERMLCVGNLLFPLLIISLLCASGPSSGDCTDAVASQVLQRDECSSAVKAGRARYWAGLSRGGEINDHSAITVESRARHVGARAHGDVRSTHLTQTGELETNPFDHPSTSMSGAKHPTQRGRMVNARRTSSAADAQGR